MKEKKLDVLSVDDLKARSQGQGIKTFGNPNTWIVLCKTVNASEGWSNSTWVMQVGVGVIVRTVKTRQNPDKTVSLSESQTCIYGVMLVPDPATDNRYPMIVPVAPPAPQATAPRSPSPAPVPQKAPVPNTNPAPPPENPQEPHFEPSSQGSGSVVLTDLNGLPVK